MASPLSQTTGHPGIHVLTPALDRLKALGAEAPDARNRLDQLMELSIRGLPQMYRDGRFVHTMRRGDPTGLLKPEGANLRYETKVALALACLDEATQRKVLAGETAADLALATVERAGDVTDDPGAVALAGWAAAEAAGIYAREIFGRLEALFASQAPVATVDCAWTLIAALSARHIANTRKLAFMARTRLVDAQGKGGLFPHMLPAESGGRFRAHVGSFADQVYSIQALARFSVAEGDPDALAAADAGAARICALQGPAGQWWWHYDAVNSTVVEGYPVYAVHQHGMGPMALLDLREAGGTDHMRSIALGLGWLDRHPETTAEMVSQRHAVIWRKVGRREPRKAARSLAAIATTLRPGLRLPGLDTLLPPSRIDYECRPYELGWLLYAWLSGGVVASLQSNRTPRT